MLKKNAHKWIFGLTLGIFLFSVSGMAYSKAKYVKIPVQKISAITKVIALKTYEGKVIPVQMIKGLTKIVKIKAYKILSKPQLELKSGEIVYPEEIKFFISKAKKSSKKSMFNKIKKHFRAPEGDD